MKYVHKVFRVPSESLFPVHRLLKYFLFPAGVMNSEDTQQHAMEKKLCFLS